MVQCHLGLEAHWVSMSQKQLDLLTSKCIPGPNKHKSKAEKMRSFQVPEEFIEPNSNHKTLRRCNVFLSLRSDSSAWALVDFSRLLHMHIISRDRPWSSEEFMVDSPVRYNDEMFSDVWFITYSHVTDMASS